MKKLLLIVIAILLFIPSTVWGIGGEGIQGGGSGVLTDSNCDQAQYYSIGTLCQDTDDGKLYKGTGAAVTEIIGTGDVTGPASPTAGMIVKWGPSGKSLVDGYTLGTGTSLGTSDVIIPSQNAVKTYIDTNLLTKQDTLTYTLGTGTDLGTSDIIVPSQNAVKTYVDNKFAISDYQPIPVEAGLDGTSAPSAAAVYTSTNKIVARDFRGDTGNQDLFFIWDCPPDLTGTTITYRVKYMITSATPPANAETVKFTLSGVAIGAVTASYTTDQLLSHAQGTAITVTDTYATATLPAQYALIQTAWSAAVTPTHLAAGKTVVLSFARDQANDTYAQALGVVGFDVKFTRTLAP